MFENYLNTYSYSFYSNTCYKLKNCGFNPRNILDIGASLCQTADIMREVWPKSNILLFEGNNAFENIYKEKKYNYHIKLLGNQNGFVNFYQTKWSKFCSGNSIYREKSISYNNDEVIIESLPIYKLDDIVSTKYDLIKIDTQGSELDIIKGGIKIFNDAKVIICEVALIDINTGGCTKEDIVNILTKQLKFDYVDIIEKVFHNDNKTIAYENLMFIKP